MKRSPVFDSDDIRHCEEGALPDEAIPAAILAIASAQRTWLAMTKCKRDCG